MEILLHSQMILRLTYKSWHPHCYRVSFRVSNLFTILVATNMENHVKVLKGLILDEFSAVTFFKRMGYQFSQKSQARDNLQEALKTLATNDDEYSRKARSILDFFDEHMDSYLVKHYWNGLELQNEREKTRTGQLVIEEKKVSIYCTSCIVGYNY